MSAILVSFVLLPCIGAILAGYLLFDWRLAAAAACGAAGLTFLGPLLPTAVRLYAQPAFTGVFVGAVTLVLLLRRRPAISVWSRMTWALGVAFVLHLFGLFFILGRI